MSGKVGAPTIFLDHEWWIRGNRTKDILNQKFATVLSDEDDFANPSCHVVNGFISRPLRPGSAKATGKSEWKIEGGEFQISVELDEFEKEELSVKRIGRYLEVHGKHEERKDQHGLVSREFRRRIRLPNNCDISAVASSYSTDCKLTITAPMIREGPGVYIVPMELPLQQSLYNPSRTEIEQDEFVEIQEACQAIYDELLETKRMKVALEAYVSERGIDGIDLDEFRRWYSQKQKPVETEIDVEIQEPLKIMDGIVQDTFDMFLVKSGSPKAPVEPKAVESNQSNIK